jgi:cytochrome P450
VNSRLLVRHPDVLKKLREEISIIIGNASDFGRDDLQKMEYLTMVLKESEWMDHK